MLYKNNILRLYVQLNYFKHVPNYEAIKIMVLRLCLSINVFLQKFKALGHCCLINIILRIE